MVLSALGQPTNHQASTSHHMYFHLHDFSIPKGYEVRQRNDRLVHHIHFSNNTLWIHITYRPLVPVSSLSIFALLLSFIILLIYGFIQYGISFKPSMLVPTSLVDTLSSIGVASFSLGYNFSYLSFFVGEESEWYSIIHSFNHPINHSIIHLINQSINQSII